MAKEMPFNALEILTGEVGKIDSNPDGPKAYKNISHI